MLPTRNSMEHHLIDPCSRAPWQRFYESYSDRHCSFRPIQIVHLESYLSKTSRN